MRLSSFFVLSLLITFFLVSCSREESFEIAAPSKGSLQSSQTGECLPKTAVGAFVAGTALTDSNYIEIEVDVAQRGSYEIRTDTLNGYSFSAMGNFEQTGINTVRLMGKGTPATEGQNEFTVIYDTTFCFASITVLPAGTTTTPAAFTLQGSGDSCSITAAAGTYAQNVTLTSSNTVSIMINATTTGSWNVSTDTQNGFSFSGRGIIASPGSQSITLTASGTPAAADTTVFTITAGGTSCSFAVNVVASDAQPPVATGDLFPLITNAWWSYDYAGLGDTLVIKNIETSVIEGKTYHHFTWQAPLMEAEDHYYRKEGSDYYRYGDITRMAFGEFDEPVMGEVLFLKEGLKVGDKWSSPDFSLTVNGVAVVMRYEFECTEVDVSKTINEKEIPGITVVVMHTKAGLPGNLADTGVPINTYYAKGIGIVYQAIDGTTAQNSSIRHWKLN